MQSLDTQPKPKVESTPSPKKMMVPPEILMPVLSPMRMLRSARLTRGGGTRADR